MLNYLTCLEGLPQRKIDARIVFTRCNINPDICAGYLVEFNA